MRDYGHDVDQGPCDSPSSHSVSLAYSVGFYRISLVSFKGWHNQKVRRHYTELISVFRNIEVLETERGDG